MEKLTQNTQSTQSTKTQNTKNTLGVNTFWQEFRQFAFQGNVLDLGIGLVIGTSFKQLTSSFVDNILMPPLGFLLGKVDFSQLYISLTGERYSSLTDAQAAGAPTVNYGLFITQLIDFLLVALSIYVVLRFVLRQKLGRNAQ